MITLLRMQRMKNGCVGEQFRHVRVKSEARMSKPETIPNDKSRLNTVSVLLGTVSLIWILILALVSDFGIRISNFVSSQRSALMPTLLRATRPCVLGGDSLGR